jgi:hypothetical protein
MEIINIDSYKDGGTIKIVTDSVIYCIDDSIESLYKGKVFIGYPKIDNSNIVDEQIEIKLEILKAIKNFKCDPFDWKPRVYNLIANNDDL